MLVREPIEALKLRFGATGAMTCERAAVGEEPAGLRFTGFGERSRPGLAYPLGFVDGSELKEPPVSYCAAFRAKVNGR
jgi:hypothetical protein